MYVTLELPWRSLANYRVCSIPAARAPTAAHTVQHEQPGQLLPAERDGAIERGIQQRGTITAHGNESEPSSAAASRRWAGAQVSGGQKYCRPATQDQLAAAVPARQPRGWFHQCE
jgi:hypothetical protein